MFVVLMFEAGGNPQTAYMSPLNIQKIDDAVFQSVMI